MALVEPHEVESLRVDFNETAAICERLGRDSTKLLREVEWKDAGRRMQDAGSGDSPKSPLYGSSPPLSGDGEEKGQ